MSPRSTRKQKRVPRRNARSARKGSRRTPRAAPARRGGALALTLLLGGAAAGALLAVQTHRLSAAGVLDLSEDFRELLDGDWLTQKLPDVSASLRSEHLRLHHVDFLGLRTLSAGPLLKRTGLPENVALIDVDPDALCASLADHPRIARCRAVRIPPDRVIVRVDERVPVGVLASSRHGIDAEGSRFPLARAEAQGLPRLTGQVEATLPLALAAQEREVALVGIRGTKGGELIFEPVRPSVRVRAYGDPQRILDDWLRLAGSGVLESHGPREVDLRFGGTAVLRDFEENKGG